IQGIEHLGTDECNQPNAITIFNNNVVVFHGLTPYNSGPPGPRRSKIATTVFASTSSRLEWLHFGFLSFSIICGRTTSKKSPSVRIFSDIQYSVVRASARVPTEARSSRSSVTFNDSGGWFLIFLAAFAAQCSSDFFSASSCSRLRVSSTLSAE